MVTTASGAATAGWPVAVDEDADVGAPPAFGVFAKEAVAFFKGAKQATTCSPLLVSESNYFNVQYTVILPRFF